MKLSTKLLKPLNHEDFLNVFKALRNCENDLNETDYSGYMCSRFFLKADAGQGIYLYAEHPYSTTGTNEMIIGVQGIFNGGNIITVLKRLLRYRKE